MNVDSVGLESYSAAYFRTRRAYVLFFYMTDIVFVFDLQTGEWFTPEICRDMYQVVFGSGAVLVDQTSDRVFLYNGIKGSCSGTCRVFAYRQQMAVDRKTHSTNFTTSGNPWCCIHEQRQCLYHLSNYATTGYTADLPLGTGFDDNAMDLFVWTELGTR